MNLNSSQLSLIDRLASELEDSISFMETIEGCDDQLMRIQSKINLLEEFYNSLKFYEEQSYLVKFDLSGQVDVNIYINHRDRMELTSDEIIEEAKGYAKDVGIDIEKKDLFEIEQLDKTPKKIKVREDIN